MYADGPDDYRLCHTHTHTHPSTHVLCHRAPMLHHARVLILRGGGEGGKKEEGGRGGGCLNY